MKSGRFPGKAEPYRKEGGKAAKDAWSQGQRSSPITPCTYVAIAHRS
jgi:hypothetical protein